MNKNSSKLKSVARILFWAVTVLSIVLALVLGVYKSFNAYIGEYRYHIYPGLFFGFLIGGPVVAYVISLLLSGFADKIDLLQNNNEKQTEIIKKMNEDSIAAATKTTPKSVLKDIESELPKI